MLSRITSFFRSPSPRAGRRPSPFQLEMLDERALPSTMQPMGSHLIAEPTPESPIAFVGGWGMSSYQYGFEGTSNHSHDDVVIDGRIITAENPDTSAERPMESLSLNYTKITFDY